MNGKMPENVPGRIGKEPSVSRSSAKDFLEQSWRLNEEIDCKIEQLDVLNALAGKTTSTLAGMPHAPGHGGSKLEDIIVKIVDLQEEINADIDRLVDLKKEMMRMIALVEDKDQRRILERRYLCHEEWPTIAVKCNLSERHTKRIHYLALKALDEKSFSDSESCHGMSLFIPPDMC